MRSKVNHISWAESRAANLANWEDRVPIHQKSYHLELFRDPHYSSDQVRDDLTVLAPYLFKYADSTSPDGNTAKKELDNTEWHNFKSVAGESTDGIAASQMLGAGHRPLAGLTVCHLQCHLGTDTVSLARAGAKLVVGVDFSSSALATARRLALYHDEPARFVQADVMAARAAVTTALGEFDFDLVYTSTGTIEWLADLTGWAQQIAELLKPGGIFYLNDSHPMLYVFDDNATTIPTPAYRYFPDGTPVACDAVQSYSGTGYLAHPRTYLWPHSISEIVNALITAGLTIELMSEGQTISWRYSPIMVEVAPNKYAWPGSLKQSIPVSLALIARKV